MKKEVVLFILRKGFKNHFFYNYIIISFKVIYIFIIHDSYLYNYNIY